MIRLERCWAWTTLFVVAVVLGGCGYGGGGGTLTELEGSWLGYEVDGYPGDWSFIITGTHLDATGAATGEWYNGTMTLNTTTDPKHMDVTIEECDYQEFIGKQSLGIYTLEGDILTMASNGPGDTTRASSFVPGQGARVFIFTKQVR